MICGKRSLRLLDRKKSLKAKTDNRRLIWMKEILRNKRDTKYTKNNFVLNKELTKKLNRN